MSHKPRRRFGQHFLHDSLVIQRIVHAINPQPLETIVEIGPGLGALTLPLLKTTANLHAVEFDRDLVSFWQTNHPHLQIHACDALLFDFAGLSNGNKIKVVGNLPYNISTPLVFHLFEVGAEAFNPPPKVESAVVRFVPHQIPLIKLEEMQPFSNFIMQAFSQRRKTLRNNLKGLINETMFLNANIDQSARPETLSIHDFIHLFRHLT